MLGPGTLIAGAGKSAWLANADDKLAQIVARTRIQGCNRYSHRIPSDIAGFLVDYKNIVNNEVAGTTGVQTGASVREAQRLFKNWAHSAGMAKESTMRGQQLDLKFETANPVHSGRWATPTSYRVCCSFGSCLKRRWSPSTTLVWLFRSPKASLDSVMSVVNVECDLRHPASNTTDMNFCSGSAALVVLKHKYLELVPGIVQLVLPQPHEVMPSVASKSWASDCGTLRSRSSSAKILSRVCWRRRVRARITRTSLTFRRSRNKGSRRKKGEAGGQKCPGEAKGASRGKRNGLQSKLCPCDLYRAEIRRRCFMPPAARFYWRRLI